MKKNILTLFFLVFALLHIEAQDNITTVFLSTPDAVLTGFDSEMKDKLLAKPDDTTKVTVSTPLYDEVKRLSITEDYIYLRTSPVATIQIKLLPLINESKIVCVIHTIEGKAADSKISFYTPKWIPIGQELFPKNTYKWFIKEDIDRDSQEFKNAVTVLDMNPMKYTISPTDNSISVDYEIEGYLSEDDYKKLEPFLTKQPKIFKWDKISYK